MRRLTILLMLVVEVAGCARTVRIAGLRSLADADVSHRQLLMAPFEPDNDVQPDYRLGLADAVEITLSSPTYPATVITVQTYQCEKNGIPCGGSFPSSGIPAAGRELLKNQRPRLSLAALGSVAGLRITAPNVTPYCVSLWGVGGFRIDPSNPPAWRQLESVMRSGFACDDATAQQSACSVACGDGPSGTPLASRPFTFHLAAVPRQRALPGDTIGITIMSRLGSRGDSGPLAYGVTHVTTTVDQWGYTFVPGLSTSISAMLRENPTENAANPTIRQWADGFDMAAYRLRLWAPEKTFDQQVPLDEVALCLSAGWSGDGTGRAPWIADEIKKCESLGADPAIYVAGSLDVARLRYEIEAVQTWTLVMPDGSVLVRSYLAGQTVGEATRSALRDISAHAGRSERLAFVTVVPAAAAFGHEPNRRAAFWAPIGRRELALDTVLLIPGDTVHLTTTRPRSR